MTFEEMDALKKTKEYKAAMALEDAVNDMSFNNEKFAKCLRFMHPTLQQNVFRLVRELIKEQAEGEDRYFDDRNKASHEMAKKLLQTLKECDGLPYI